MKPTVIPRNKITKLYKSGKSKNYIAKKMGCSRAYVYKVLAQAGLYSPAKAK